MNCDRIARAYRYLEYLAFGRVLQICRTAFLDHTTQCQSALVIGDGDGRFLKRLCNANRTLQICSIDTSQAMLALQHSRLGDVTSERVQFLPHDARLGTPGGGYDLIATHFFFDCLLQSEADALVQEIAAAAASDATWLISEFHMPDGFWLHWRAALWIEIMYAFFRLTTGLRIRQIPAYAPALVRHGFSLVASRTFSAGMIRAEVWKRAEQ